MSTLIEQRTERTKWFNEARFGMFIHWGLYAIPARGEWVRNREQMSIHEYQKYFHEFTAKDYDPKEWARLAKKAGMKYAVLTAKHHDGFCLFDTSYTDYSSINAPCRRDLVREFLEAFRAEGIKVGLYYSIIDWYHPDYPHYGDLHHPSRFDEQQKNDSRNFDNYLKYMHGQIRELLTNYGKLDIMWFDFSYEDMVGEKWQATQLMEMIRELQPQLITDNRLEGSGDESGSILTANPTIYAGDFACPEQMIPPSGILNELGDPIPWEACITLNKNWGYHAGDHHWKSSELIVRMLIECVSKNGNLLLNVGPDAYGNIPKPSAEILKEVGQWMAQNSDSIYGCGKADFPKPEWGRFTQNGNKLYAHVMEEQVGAIPLLGLNDKIESMRLLKDGAEIKATDTWNVTEYTKEYAFFFLEPGATTNYPLSDKKSTVVEITLKE